MIKLFKKKEEDKEKVEAQKEEAVEVEKAEVALPQGKDAAGYSIIRQPHITEKASNLAFFNQHVFKVMKSSNKAEVKKAVENLYKVKVENVRTVNLPSKKRQVGKHEGLKPGYKKAIVKLKDGYSIESKT